MVSNVAVITVVLILFMMLAMMVVYAFSYKKVPPHKAMVIFRGSRKKGTEPHRIISGGGKFILPGAESYSMLDLTADLIELELSGVETRSEGAPTKIRLKVALVWKITTERSSLEHAAGKLVDRTRGENRIEVKKQVEDAIRNLGPSLTVQEFEQDRDAFSGRFQMTMGHSLSELGIEIRSLHILKVQPQG